MKRFQLAIMLAAAALLTFAFSPSWAQKSDALEEEARGAQERMRAIRYWEKQLRGAEEARLKGDCTKVASYHLSFQTNLAVEPWSMEIVADLRRRMEEIARGDCPPGSGKPSITLPPPAAPDDILGEIRTDTDRTPTGLPPSPIDPPPPVVDPAPVGSVSSPASEPRRAAPPVAPRKPDIIHVPPPPVAAPAPVGSVSSPAPEPRRAAPPVPPRKPDIIHVPPPPVAAVSTAELPPSLETMIRETDSRQRYLELRQMAEPGAVRTKTPPLESILDEIDDSAVVATVRTCQSALKKIPPPFAAAVLAAGSRATEKPDLWYPAPAFSDTRAAAEACAPLDSKERIAALEDELFNAIMADHFEKQFGSRFDDVRPTATVRKELDEAYMDRPIDLFDKDVDVPVKLDPVSTQFLDLHNEARAEVGAAPLKWDRELAAGAAAYASQLTTLGRVHSSREGRKDIRENLLQSLRGGRTPEQMIGVWTAEKRYLVSGIFPNVSSTGNWYDVGHYTQLIWPTTTRLGCAVHSDARFDWLVCRYSPPGNRDGHPVK